MAPAVRTLQIGCLSLPAVVAALLFMPSQAEACSATSAVRGGVPVVDVVCNAGDPAVFPFATSYTTGSFGGSAGDGADTLTMTGGSVLVGAAGAVLVDGGPDTLDPSTSFLPVQVIDMGPGNDLVVISGGRIGTRANPVGIALDNASGPLGADTFRMSGGTVTGSIFGLGGGNTYEVSGGTIGGSIFAGSQDDTVTISGTAHIHGDRSSGTDAVGLEDGNDRFTMTGGTLDGSVSGGNGDDVILISGGFIGSFVTGNAGADQITISGGTITGDVDGASVTITGGSIGGDIFGQAIVIDDAQSATPINLRNGVLFSGDGAVASIFDTDLAAGGSKTQNFFDFSRVSTSNSTLGFGPGTVDIGTLALGNGSTLFTRGAVTVTGTVAAANSTITMINGSAGDRLTLGGLTLNSSRVGIDIDQSAGRGDQLLTGNLLTSGTNVVSVNLLGTPVFATTVIPIIIDSSGTIAPAPTTPSAAPVPGTFVATGLPGTQASLFNYQIVQGASGLVLVIAPGAVGPAAAVQDATDTSIVDTVLDALEGIKNDALDFDLGLGVGSGATLVPISDTLGVFASGQLAHTEHDGFDISANGFTGPGPSFGADEFSAALSLDFNLAKTLDVEDKYGINLGLFGGYASIDMNLDGFDGFIASGNGENRSGMFGAYGLFRKELNYALIAATAFLGNSDVTNGILGSTGSYDTAGYAVTASFGHIFIIGDKTRFDLRGGVLGVNFEGDDYVDSNGNRMGGTQISFGAFKFEPGIYRDIPLDNGMTFSPYARAELQQRFGYENTASIDDIQINYDDADFSAALSTGFNLKMSKTATMSGEVRGKVSNDATTVAGKLGLKIAF
jgi:hypothetical protein